MVRGKDIQIKRGFKFEVDFEAPRAIRERVNLPSGTVSGRTEVSRIIHERLKAEATPDLSGKSTIKITGADNKVVPPEAWHSTDIGTIAPTSGHARPEKQNLTVAGYLQAHIDDAMGAGTAENTYDVGRVRQIMGRVLANGFEAVDFNPVVDPENPNAERLPPVEVAPPTGPNTRSSRLPADGISTPDLAALAGVRETALRGGSFDNKRGRLNSTAEAEALQKRLAVFTGKEQDEVEAHEIYMGEANQLGTAALVKIAEHEKLKGLSIDQLRAAAKNGKSKELNALFKEIVPKTGVKGMNGAKLAAEFLRATSVDGKGSINRSTAEYRREDGVVVKDRLITGKMTAGEVLDAARNRMATMNPGNLDQDPEFAKAREARAAEKKNKVNPADSQVVPKREIAFTPPQ